MRNLYLCITAILISGCSLFGKSGVEIAPYRVLTSDQAQNIELRHYDRLVLVSTPMQGNIDDNKNGAFGRLFNYISGNNIQSSKIAMTAPVFMDETNESPSQEPYQDEGIKIPMTAPVFMDESQDQSYMSFVLPDSYTIETAPRPKSPDVKLEELTDYKVAVITFSGTLGQSNIDKHAGTLKTWINAQGYTQTGPYKAAGYNPPFTLPALRRNEVLIPVDVK
jgi:hypothetical protein